MTTPSIADKLMNMKRYSVGYRVMRVNHSGDWVNYRHQTRSDQIWMAHLKRYEFVPGKGLMRASAEGEWVRISDHVTSALIIHPDRRTDVVMPEPSETGESVMATMSFFSRRDGKPGIGAKMTQVRPLAGVPKAMGFKRGPGDPPPDNATLTANSLAFLDGWLAYAEPYLPLSVIRQLQALSIQAKSLIGDYKAAKTNQAGGFELLDSAKLRAVEAEIKAMRDRQPKDRTDDEFIDGMRSGVRAGLSEAIATIRKHRGRPA